LLQIDYRYAALCFLYFPFAANWFSPGGLKAKAFFTYPKPYRGGLFVAQSSRNKTKAASRRTPETTGHPSRVAAT